MAKASQPTVTDLLKNGEVELDKIFVGKLPALPDNVKELIVKLSPWFALISMILMLPLILAVFGLGALVMPFSYLGGMHAGFGYTFSLIFTLGMIILELMAIPGLFKRQMKAWRLMYYSIILSLVQQLLRFDLFGLVIGGAISFYFLFQVRSKYTK
jgi:hypothetical protein